jgi:serine/threonine protein kinase
MIIYKGQLTELDAAAISAYLISIIKYLHKNNIIIRNLRPETILFEEKDSYDIKIVDLSLAMEKKYY